MIDERKCKLIRTIAEQRSISKAAQVLFVSQPSLSRYVRDLESKLGVLLFDRSRIPLEITPAGEKYLSYIAKFEDLQAIMDHDFDVLREHEKPKLAIGTLPYLGAYILPRIIPQFVMQYPETTINIEEYTALACERALLNDDIDLCLTNLPPKKKQIKYSTVIADPVVLVALRTPELEREYDLAGNSIDCPAEIDLAQMEDATFILLHPWQNMRVMADEALRAYHVTPKSILETMSVASALNLVSCNRGVTFVCRSALQYAKISFPLAYYSLNRMERNQGAVLLAYKERTEGSLVDLFCATAVSALAPSVVHTT